MTKGGVFGGNGASQKLPSWATASITDRSGEGTGRMKKMVGLIVAANYQSDSFAQLTKERPVSLRCPFGGRYRLVDFPLSNMVNSAVSTPSA